MYEQRLEIIRKELAVAKVDGVVLADSPTVRWATGLDSSNALVFVSADEALLVTDGRYAEAARQQVGNARVAISRVGAFAVLLETLSAELKVTPQRLGFDAERILVGQRDEIQAALASTTLVPLSEFLAVAVAQKSAAEIESIAQAQKITDAVFSELLEVITPGMTEKQLAAEVVYRQLQHGADEMPADFWPIISSGPNTALPHAKATGRKIENQDVVLLDFGCTVDGYCSDMTRMVVVGAPLPKFREVYATVLRAQEAALAAAKAGMVASSLDAVARDIVEAAGYEIPHGLGHALGLEIHEWPSLNKRTHVALPEHAVVTIEPGIYLPGEFGVRIEDIVVLEADGCRNLTTAPKELIIL